MASTEISESLKEMPSGTHAILVYDTLDHKRDVILRHLMEGVGQEGLVYAYSVESPGAARQYLESHGMAASELERKGELSIIDAEEVYLKEGKVDIDRIFRGFSEMAWGYRKTGLKGLRAGAEMAPFFRKGMLRELELYEESLGRKFTFPAKGICAYGVVDMQNSGRLQDLLPIFMAHAMVITSGPGGYAVREPEEVKKQGLIETVKSVLSGRGGTNAPVRPQGFRPVSTAR